MHVTELEIILAVVAVFIIFGPKRLPQRQKKEQTIKLQKERLNVRPPAPVQPAVAPFTYAAGRAPSPLQLRAAERPLPALGQTDQTRPQFASKDVEGSPLPHEMLRV